ncbi:MAG TPA: sugar ABC transporter permease [Candidatus Limiplasma sp.]|nr:sugar ABC transporter permease [Candidatus Limiplasma sp.]
MATDKGVTIPKAKRFSRRRIREWTYGYLFILPWIVGVIIFFLYPAAESIRYSLSDVQLTNPMQVIFWGFKNYINVFVTDSDFPVAIVSFAIELVLKTPIIVAFALIISLMLNEKIKARALYRMLFFLPVIIATGPVMDELTSQGVASVPMVSQAAFMTAISGALPAFLADPISDLLSSLILVLWNSGVQILIFIAGLQKVPRAMYEAARIDGASGWESFWKITLPVIKPMILLNTIYTIVFLATGGQNEIITMIYDNMFYAIAGRGYGYAAAMAWVYTVIIGIALLIAFLLLREKSDRKVVYESRRIKIKGEWYSAK